MKNDDKATVAGAAASRLRCFDPVSAMTTPKVQTVVPVTDRMIAVGVESLCNGDEAPYWLDPETNTLEVL